METFAVMVTVMVMNLGGNTTEIKASLQTTIEKLKKKLQEQIGFPSSWITLFDSQKQDEEGLKDEMKLESIAQLPAQQGDTTIHLTMIVSNSYVESFVNSLLDPQNKNRCVLFRFSPYCPPETIQKRLDFIRLFYPSLRCWTTNQVSKFTPKTRYKEVQCTWCYNGYVSDNDCGHICDVPGCRLGKIREERTRFCWTEHAEPETWLFVVPESRHMTRFPTVLKEYTRYRIVLNGKTLCQPDDLCSKRKLISMDCFGPDETEKQ